MLLSTRAKIHCSVVSMSLRPEEQGSQRRAFELRAFVSPTQAGGLKAQLGIWVLCVKVTWVESGIVIEICFQESRLLCKQAFCFKWGHFWLQTDMYSAHCLCLADAMCTGHRAGAEELARLHINYQLHVILDCSTHVI